jgi:3'(2'), 5'-bisphosphate nucleotidase
MTVDASAGRPAGSQRWQRERRIARKAVLDACRLCESVGSAIAPGTMAKPDRSPVTVADFGAQAVICHAIGEAFPDDPVMAEEDSTALRSSENTATLDSVVGHVGRILPGAAADDVCAWIDRGDLTSPVDRFWVLDPIDGTKGFLRGEQYAVALALIQDARVVLAVLGCPRLACASAEGRPGVVFVAEAGLGTVQSPIAGPDLAVPAKVSAILDVEKARLCEPVESAHSHHQAAADLARHLSMSVPPCRLDSQAKYGVVARGDGDVYLRLPRDPVRRERVWDHAAGALVVAEAGGRVTDARGADLDWSTGAALERNVGVLVTNGLLHERVLQGIRELDLV